MTKKSAQKWLADKAKELDSQWADQGAKNSIGYRLKRRLDFVRALRGWCNTEAQLSESQKGHLEAAINDVDAIPGGQGWTYGLFALAALINSCRG